MKIYIILFTTDLSDHRIYKNAYPTEEQAMDVLKKLQVEKPFGEGLYHFSEMNLVMGKE